MLEMKVNPNQNQIDEPTLLLHTDDININQEKVIVRDAKNEATKI